MTHGVTYPTGQSPLLRPIRRTAQPAQASLLAGLIQAPSLYDHAPTRAERVSARWPSFARWCGMVTPPERRPALRSLGRCPSPRAPFQGLPASVSQPALRLIWPSWLLALLCSSSRSPLLRSRALRGWGSAGEGFFARSRLRWSCSLFSRRTQCRLFERGLARGSIVGGCAVRLGRVA